MRDSQEPKGRQQGNGDRASDAENILVEAQQVFARYGSKLAAVGRARRALEAADEEMSAATLEMESAFLRADGNLDQAGMDRLTEVFVEELVHKRLAEPGR